MKSFTFRLNYVLTLSLLVLSMGAKAQWTYTVDYMQNAGNPGGLVTTNFLSGTNIISQSQASNSWSAPQTIPFPFDFAGTPVTQWKVSGNGVVTFDLGMALPGSNDALPSAQLSPMTIAGMWDSFTTSPPTGSNDYVRVTTVGTAPNRQQWIFYYSYEIGSPVVSFHYWAIVLEETTNKIYVVDQYSNSSTFLSSTVGVQIDATTATMWPSSPNTPQSGNGSGTADNDYWVFQPLLMKACAGAPTVPPISSSVPFVTNTTTNVNLSFTSTLPLISTTGLSYQWQSSLDGISYTNITGETGLTLSTTIAATTYFQCAVTCANGGAVTNSNAVQVELAPPPSITVNSVTPISCTSSVAHTVSAEILVGAGTFSAPSSCDYVFNLVDDYGDGWNGATMQILNGATVIATLGSGFATGSTATETVALQNGVTYTLFWNNGGGFAEEVGISVVDPSGSTIYTLPVFSPAAAGTTLYSIAGSCPSNAITFTYSYDGGVTNTSATITNTTGNTYTADIPAATPVNAPVSWTISATNSYGLVTTLSGSYQDSPTLGFSVAAVATPSTICAGESTVLNAVISPVAAYTDAPVSSTADEDIGNVTIINANGDTLLNNTSAYLSLDGTVGTATGIAGRYSNFAALTNIPMVAGSTYNFSISSIDLPSFYNNSLAIFIDYNKDGDFTDAGEMVYQPPAVINGPHTRTGSFTVPSWVFGTMRMRVVCLETLITSYATTSSWGEREDYTITVASGVTWFAGTTNVGTGVSLTQAPTATTDYTCEVMAGICPITSSIATVVVNALPAAPIATNSTQCGIQVPTASVASTAGVDGTGMFYWYDAATAGNVVQFPPAASTWTTFFNDDFSGATVATGATTNGSANLTNTAGWLELTAAANGLQGGITVDAGIDAQAYKVEFDVQTTAGGADGFSWSFAPDANATATSPAAEKGTGTKVKISFDAYGAMPNGAGTYLLYNNTAASFNETTAGVLAFNAATPWLGTASAHVTITINEAGLLTMNIDGTDLFTDVALPASYLTENKAAWKHVVSARTGGLNMLTAIDNLNVAYKGFAPGSTTYTSVLANDATFYVSELGTNGCYSAATPISIAVSQPPAIDFANSASAICIGESVTLNMSSVIVPPYTYTVTSPNAASGLTGSVTGTTHTFTPTASGTMSYIVTAANGNCTEVDTVDIAVVPTASPAPIIVMDTITICPSATSAAFTAANSAMDVNYTFNLLDSYGDGWNGNALQVFFNGVLENTLTFTTGSSFSTTINVPEGTTITTAWTTGSFLAECSFNIVVGGATVHTGVMTTAAAIPSQMFTGSVPAYNYTIQWYNAATGGTLLGTGATFETIGSSVLPNLNTTGQYTVYAVQSNGCLSPATPAIVNVTNVLADIVAIDATCNSVANGSFSVGTITCGTTPFTFSVDGGAFGAIPTNLAFGNHTVVIQDATGAVAPAVSFFVDQPTWITNVPNFVANGWACKDETSEIISAANPNLTISDTLVIQTAAAVPASGNFTITSTLNIPIGATVTSATLLVNGLTTTGGTWASDLDVTVSGIGSLSVTPSGFTVTNANYSYPLSGVNGANASVTVSIANNWFGSATIASLALAYEYTLQQTLDNITWYAAPVGGQTLGSGFTLESVGTTVLPNTTVPGVYNFYAQGELDGCSSFTRLLVPVTIQAPTIVASTQTATVCPGEFLTLSATGGISYSWSNGAGQNTPFVPMSSSFVTATQSYVVNGFDIDGCANQDTVVVTVIPQPILNPGLDQTICDGTPVILYASTTPATATAVSSYAWNNNVANNAQFVPTTSTVVTVVATGANGCTTQDSVQITVLALPTVNAGVDQTICAGTGATLNATGAVSYVWNNNVSQGVAFFPTASQIYTVTGIGANGCTNVDQVQVNVATGPSVTVSAPQTVCSNDAATFSAVSQNSLGGFWTTSGNGTITPSISSAAITYLPAANDPVVVTLTYVATSACGNSSSTTNVNVLPIPVVDAGPDQTICSGSSVVLNAAGTGNITWGTSNVNNGFAFVPVSTATYTATATGLNNCTNQDEVTVTVVAIPDVDAGDDLTICSGEQVTLTASGATAYQWTGGIANGTPFAPGTTATYTVTGTTVNGCAGTDQVIVTVNATPEAIASIVDDVTLTATPGVYNYQWINCATGEAVPNASFATFNASANGTYAVIVSTPQGCSDQSDCITIDAVSVEQITEIAMSVQPNPTSGELSISMPTDLTAQAQVFDAQGKLVIDFTNVSNGSSLNLTNMTTGVYMIRISAADSIQTFRVVKQ